ncbi:tyrosinase [Fusarium subglutinans]|uniref:tyrosinase n=1 Tax=Gibberella subglutinans TaxID=42677 RepID=A0A8H5PBB3_GIBSU|nr:tyrosinase [Fusarium subglutinans]KAF5593547.1 tyrosinase [Fusarium subglutinans]
MRVRRSLKELVSLYDAGDRTQLENLVRAFRKIQTLPPNDPDSFFVIAGYHGEPFVKEDPTNPDWWGAYLYRLENALRNALPEAPDLALPFWDECATHGTVKITPDGDPKTTIPDTYSVYSRFQICLKAPNYTVFSNKASMAQYIIENGGQPHYGVALEEPHNAIHLALGGFYEKGNYNADPFLGANGDMGENETAAFDPILYLHHAFIDYTFWQWQLRHDCTATGSLTVEAGKDGTISLGDPTFPKGTALDTNSPLNPFTKPSGGFYTSEDVTDINKLGYSYGRGSLDNDPARFEPPTEPIAKIARVHNVSRADYAGSFVIRTHVELPSGEKVEVGREAVLSRWNVAGCRNCQDRLNENSFIAIDNKTMEVLKGNTDDEAKINFHVQIQSREFGGDKFHAPVREPAVEFL